MLLERTAKPLVTLINSDLIEESRSYAKPSAETVWEQIKIKETQYVQ